MAVDFATFRKCAPFITDERKPILIRGRHGIGKSEIVYQIAGDIGLPVVERRASQMTEGDLLGLPSTDGDVTSWNPPDWLANACETPVILFLDEIDRATPEVRQGIFELTDSRKIAGNVLHPDTLIFAAINGGEHGAQYQVGEMDPAELDRYAVFDLEPTVEDWLDWGKDNIDSMVWDYINQNRTHLEHSGEHEPNKVYPSRRSWKRLNDCLVTAGLMLSGAETEMFHVCTAFVGFEASVSFRDFIENYSRQVTVEDILDSGKSDKTKEFSINEHCALIEKMEASEAFAKVLSETQVANLATYFVSLDSEPAMKLWAAIGKGERDNVIALHKAESADGSKVGHRLVELLTGDNN